MTTQLPHTRQAIFQSLVASLDANHAHIDVNGINFFNMALADFVANSFTTDGTFSSSAISISSYPNSMTLNPIVPSISSPNAVFVPRLRVQVAVHHLVLQTETI